MRLTLASGSPRRRELIRALDIDARIMGGGGDEDAPKPRETASAYVRRLALVKAQQARKAAADALILSADTTVDLDGILLGKPDDNAHAARMLTMLRGKTHKVVTGVALLDAANGKYATTAKATKVRMRHYSDAEIAAYIARGETQDKAGAYAAQDKIFNPAATINGCYLNVIGLPLCDVLRLLRDMGAPARLRRGWQPPAGCDDCAQWAATPQTIRAG